MLVSQQFPPDTALGGLGTQAAAKAAGLAALGHRVHVLSRTGGVGGTGGTMRRVDGVHVTRMPAPELAGHTEVARALAMSVQVAVWLDRLRADHGDFDVVDVPEYGGQGLVALADRTEWHDVPVVVQVHGSTDMLATHIGWPEPGSVHHRLGALMEREAMRMADLVYASSAFSARWVEQELSLPAGHVPVWHCGVDTTRFRPRADPGGPPTVVFVGRVTPSKGIDDLLRAVRTARERVPDLRLRLVGSVDGAGRRAVARLGGDHVEVCGAVPRHALPDLLAGATAFAAPSAFEAGPGLVYLEAMACGVPVIAPDVGGVGEVVLPGRTGVLVPPGDVQALAAAIVDLAEDPARRRRLAASARRWVVAHADTSALLPALLALYERVAR